MKITLTNKGKETVKFFIEDLHEKRKEILDAKKDTAEDTNLPTEEDIISDIEEFVDEDGGYYNSWDCTDHYDSDWPLGLQKDIDFTMS